MSLLLFLLSFLLDGPQGQMESYFLQVQRIVKAQEGLCIFVPCSFSSPEGKWLNRSPLYGYWFKGIRKPSLSFPVATNNKDKVLEWEARGRFQLLGDISKKNCSLLIKDVQWGDSTNYFFRMERGFERFSFKEEFRLQVEALTQKPDIFIPEVLEPGEPVTVVCLFSWTFNQCPAPSFSWMGDAVSFQESRPHTSNYSVLSFIPGLQHHDTELTCQLDFSRMSTQRTVRLRVAYAPRSLAISIFHDNVSVPDLHENPSHLEVQQGQSLRLLCTADSQPPATLSWVLEDQVLSWSSPVGSRTLALELPWVKAGDSGHYTCQAENRLGSQQHTLDLSVLCEYDLPKVPGPKKDKGVTSGYKQSDYCAACVGDPMSDAPTHPQLPSLGGMFCPGRRPWPVWSQFPVFIADPPQDLRVTVSQANRTGRNDGQRKLGICVGNGRHPS